MTDLMGRIHFFSKALAKVQDDDEKESTAKKYPASSTEALRLQAPTTQYDAASL